MTVPTLMVLAAGMGSRYGGLKQVDPVGPGGETILDYSVYDAKRAGYGRVVFIIRRDIEDVFKEKVGSRFADRIPVDYAYQQLDDLPGGLEPPADREKPWGTAHAIWAARDIIDSNFAVINADDYYGKRSMQLLADHLRRSKDDDLADYSMVGYVLGNTLSDHGHVNRAVCQCDAEGNLVEAVETLKIERDGDRARFPGPNGEPQYLTTDTLVSMNMFGFTPSFFGYIERDLEPFLRERMHEAKSELYIPTVVNGLINEGKARMKVLPSEDSWFGVTYPEDKAHVECSIRELIDQGVYPERLWD